MNTQRRVTAKDVARRAGVSQSTVSYVLNDTPNQTISDDTKKRVRLAAEELNYMPSAAARTLRRGTSDTVLVIIRDAQIGRSLRKSSKVLSIRLTHMVSMSFTAVNARAKALLTCATS